MSPLESSLSSLVLYTETMCVLRRHSTEVIPTLDPYNRQAAIDSYADALRGVFICQTALSVVMLICCVPIQENPLPYVSAHDACSGH